MTRINTVARSAKANLVCFALALVCLWLAGCGTEIPGPGPLPGNGNGNGNGNGGGDDEVIRKSRLFIANFGNSSVISYENPWMVDGDIAPDTNLEGAQTQLFQPNNLVVDNFGALTVANFGAPSVVCYTDADTVDGDRPPDRHVQGPQTLLAQTQAMAHQPVGDVMFVLTSGTRIDVFRDASAASFDGDLPPVRGFDAVVANNSRRSMCVGNDDDLYVSSFSGSIHVYASASTINGAGVPSRTIEGPLANDIFIDRASDTLFVLESSGFVHIFDNASTLDGPVVADARLQVPGAASLYSMCVDSFGTGYISDALNNAVYSYDNIADLDGFLAPDRTIRGPATLIHQPLKVYVFETEPESE